MADLTKLCVHTITTKGLNFKKVLAAYKQAGIPAISIWEQVVDGYSPEVVKALLKKHDMQAVSYVRGGFFVAKREEKRQEAIHRNQEMLMAAANMDIPQIVLVCGADPYVPLSLARQQIHDGIEAIRPLAEQLGVQLAIEPLHPMYADSRSAINSLRQANDLAEAINSPFVGVCIDVYHVWWDETLKGEIKRCGAQSNIFSFHICDWKSPTEDLLLDRGLMGEGCIPIRQIGDWVMEAGFDGFWEVEIFSKHYWKMDPHLYLEKIVAAYSTL